MDAVVSAQDVQAAAKMAERKGQWLLAVFSAGWCALCPGFKDDLREHIAANYEVACVEVDVGNEETEELKEAHGVTKLPTLLVLDGEGKAVARMVQPKIADVRTAALAMFKPKAVTDGDF